MRRPFPVLFIGIGLLPTAFASSEQAQHTIAELVEATLDSVVLIVVSDQKRKGLAGGSGFIVSPDGKIVTNHHVIAGGHSALVRLNNGAFFAGGC
jgi:S1-C subfamily serine protease